MGVAEGSGSGARPEWLEGVVPMILAAGRATRLRPLTERRAKAVVPFLNRPLLDYTLDWLARAGFRRVVINLHHAGETIARRYGHRAFGLRIDYSHEDVLLGTGGGPRKALAALGERVLLVNGDVLTLAALGPLLEHHRRSGALSTLGLFRGPTAEDYPQVMASVTGELIAFPGDDPGASAGEDTVSGVFAGIHVVERRALEALPSGVPCGIVGSLYREALELGLPLAAVPLAGSWFEIGTPALYIDGQLRALSRGLAPLARIGQRPLQQDGIVSPVSHLEYTRPRVPFLIGAGARVKNAAQVTASVVGDRARVEVGARVEETVVWSGGWVGPGARLRRCVVMDEVRVAPGTVAEETVFTPEGAVAFGRGRERAC